MFLSLGVGAAAFHRSARDKTDDDDDSWQSMHTSRSPRALCSLLDDDANKNTIKSARG
jgi:hypothetical protein